MADAEITFNKAALERELNGPNGSVAKFFTKRLVQATAQARREAPVKTGELRSKIDWKIGKDGRGLFGVLRAYAAHAVPVHQGTRPHVILPKRGRFLRFTSGGRVVYAKKVNHPGTKANPFLVRAVRKVFR